MERCEPLIPVRLPLSMLVRLRRAAALTGEGEAALIRGAVSARLERIEREARGARAGPRAGDGVDRLRRLAAQALAGAGNWAAVQDALRREGVELHEIAGGLGLRRASDGREICPARAVGLDPEALARRFGGPLGGGPQPDGAGVAGVAERSGGIALR